MNQYHTPPTYDNQKIADNDNQQFDVFRTYKDSAL